MDGMKGLFRVAYDCYFHEYVYLVCISQDEKKLSQRAAFDNPETQVFNSCDESEAERDDLAERHISHYIIMDVDVI